MADPVAPAVECSDVVFSGPDSDKMPRWRSSYSYVCGLACEIGRFLSWVLERNLPPAPHTFLDSFLHPVLQQLQVRRAYRLLQ